MLDQSINIPGRKTTVARQMEATRIIEIGHRETRTTSSEKAAPTKRDIRKLLFAWTKKLESQGTSQGYSIIS